MTQEALTQPQTPIPPQFKGASPNNETWTLIRRLAAEIRLKENKR